MEQDRKTNRKIIIAALVSFVCIVLLWFGISYISVFRNYYDFVADDGWTVYVEDQMIAEDCKLSNINFGTLDRLSELVITKKLDDSWNEPMSLHILVYLCTVDAYVDGEQIYTFGHEELEKNTLVGSGYHFIKVPENSSGKTLTIKMIMNEDGAFTSIAAPKAVNQDMSVYAYATGEVPALLIGVFLMMFGIILTAVGIVAVTYDAVYRRVFHIGLFACLIGSWSILSNKAAQVISQDLINLTMWEYFSLYFSAIPFTTLVLNMRKDDKTWRKVILIITSAVLFIFDIVAFILHQTNIARYPQTLKYFHMLAGIGIIMIAIAGFISVKDKSKSEVLTTVAVIVTVFMIVIDLIRFNVQKYYLPNVDALQTSIIPLAALLFIIMLLISYLLYMYDLVMTKTERDTLMSLAFKDVMTGLYNRAKFEEANEDLEARNANYAMINFDVNGLKYVNDTFGHSEGDNLLTTFTEALNKSFTGLGTAYRLGGDEFLVIVEEKYFKNIDPALKQLEINEKNVSQERKYEVTASYGVAYKYEVKDATPAKVYSLADERMYEMKVINHKSRTYQSFNNKPN